MRTADNPLAGKRIVLTRTPEQAGILLHELKGSGAQVIVLPFIEFRAPEDSGPLDAALSRLAEFDWIVFTSQNAVRFFCRRLKELGRDFAGLPAPRPKIAALGAATRDAASREGLSIDLVTGDARSGREFVMEFSRNARGKKVLLPQSDQAEPHVADGLLKGGANVTPVVAYRTCMPESLDGEELNRVRQDGADAFVFASPSAFRNFARTIGTDALKALAEHSAFVAIGPTTAQAIREAGVRVKVEAARPSSREIIAAMLEYFSTNDMKARP
ncbi:MAG TPA: uroporphyrinogen-III synthase [Candidatus Acidoferrum sp.]|nr:uroporphyrinogen-III synthase [Candidatus Acidoferrum sp.]